MQKTSIFLIIFSFALLFGCKHDLPAPTNGEGVITYKIIYPENHPYKNMPIPQETILVFKNTKASFITSGFGIIQVINLLDIDKKKYTSLLINSLGENFAFTETHDEILKQENNPEYSFEITEEKKVIAGLECNKAIVTDKNDKTTFDVYFYGKVKVFLGCSPYKNFNYLLLEYPHTKYGLPMQLLATHVDFSPVDTSLLSIQGQYKWVDKETFISSIKNLKIPL